MTSKIEGISAETVEAAIKSAHSKYSYLCGGNAMTNDGDFYVVSKAIAEITKASIASLLASGDVVLRKDVEEYIEKWRGIGKLTEECGEVLQLIGKLIPFPNGKHPDGAGDLRERLQEEVGDLYASLDYFSEHNLDQTAIHHRRVKKYKQFSDWVLSGLKLAKFTTKPSEDPDGA